MNLLSAPSATWTPLPRRGGFVFRGILFLDMNPRLRISYNEWRVHQPEKTRGIGASCCSKPHWVEKAFSTKLIPVDDDLVCPRERAWRHYVRNRDRNPTYGTPLQEFVEEGIGDAWHHDFSS